MCVYVLGDIGRSARVVSGQMTQKRWKNYFSQEAREKDILIFPLVISSSTIPSLPREWSLRKEEESLTHRIMPKVYFLLVWNVMFWKRYDLYTPDMV